MGEYVPSSQQKDPRQSQFPLTPHVQPPDHDQRQAQQGAIDKRVDRHACQKPRSVVEARSRLDAWIPDRGDGNAAKCSSEHEQDGVDDDEDP